MRDIVTRWHSNISNILQIFYLDILYRYSVDMEQYLSVWDIRLGHAFFRVRNAKRFTSRFLNCTARGDSPITCDHALSTCFFVEVHSKFNGAFFSPPPILYDFSAHISSAWNACSSTNWAHLVTWAVPKLRCKGLQYREIQNNASLCNMDFVSSSIVCKSSDRCIPSGQSQFSIQAQFRDGLETLSFLRFVGSNIFNLSSLFKI